MCWCPPQRAGGGGALCSTQLVPGGFTEGQIREEHYAQLRQVRAPAALFDSEILHRGAATPPLAETLEGPLGAPLGAGWVRTRGSRAYYYPLVSSCSVELCPHPRPNPSPNPNPNPNPDH